MCHSNSLEVASKISLVMSPFAPCKALLINHASVAAHHNVKYEWPSVHSQLMAEIAIVIALGSTCQAPKYVMVLYSCMHACPSYPTGAVVGVGVEVTYDETQGQNGELVVSMQLCAF
jgi:hypothetical protein